MGLFARLFGATEKRALEAPTEDLLRIFGITPTASGISITPETALRSPTAFAAVKAISETSGMLPVAVRRRADTGWTKVTDHPASRVLNGFASPWQSSEQLRTQIAVDALLHRKGGFARVVRLRGEPRELHRLPPTAVTVEQNARTGEPLYKVALANGGTESLSWRDVVHLQAPGSTFERSMCPTVQASDAIALEILLAEHETKVFRGGGLPRIFLSPEAADISPDALLKAIGFVARQMGDEIGKPVILPAAFKDGVKSFGLSDMQFIDLRRLARELTAAAYGVPQTVVGDLSRGTYSNVEQQSRAFVQKLLPWLEAWEGALTRCLIEPADREDIELEFILEDLLRADTAARATAYRQAAGGAWLTRNEVRELEGRPPVAGGNELLNQAGQTGAGPGSEEPPADGDPEDA